MRKHLVLISKKSLSPEQLHTLYDLIGDGYYTISLNDDQYDRFWEHWKEIKGKAIKEQKKPKDQSTFIGEKEKSGKGKVNEDSPENIGEVKQLFTENLRKNLGFSYIADDEIRIEIKADFLNSNDFGHIAKIVRENGGEYVQKKDISYFTIPIQRGDE